MDKVLLKRDDVLELFAWMQDNKDLVRSMPMPLKAVEIAFVYNDIRIKGIREERWLTLYVFLGNERLAKVVMEINALNQLIHRKGETRLTRESFNDVLSCYCTLMAYMVYEKPELVEAEPQQIQNQSQTKKHKKVYNRNRVTYILKKRKVVTPLGGHHASPKGIFTVRGHYRHYKTGKVVWIQEFKKGEGKKKSKTYKLGQGEELRREVG